MGNGRNGKGKSYVWWGIGLIVVALLVLWLAGFFGQSGQTIGTETGDRVPCLDSRKFQIEEYHWHPKLAVSVNGQPQTVPANVGIDVRCHRVLHTHDETGTIHIELNEYKPYTLGDFFAVWGEPFSKDEVLGYKADDTHEVAMTVDGAPSDDYEDLELKDRQQIIVEYREKAKEQ